MIKCLLTRQITSVILITIINLLFQQAICQETPTIDIKLLTTPDLSLEIVIPNGWKTYSTDSTIGMPSKISVVRSENIENIKFSWPTPKKMKTFDKYFDGYEGKIKLPISITYKNNAPALLVIEAQFLICSDSCVPIKKVYSFIIPPGFSQEPISFKILLLALLGGIILNFMPCVLPVLAIKIYSLSSNNNDYKQKLNAIATSLGIISTFLFFALAITILKYFSKNVGWGFHFQNPFFLAFMVFIVLIFACSSFELFNIRISIKNQPITSFGSGIIATLLATPCTGPFIGTVASIALEQTAIWIFLIFSAIGIGFALPSLLISFFPKIPFLKPGNWMNYFKKALGIGILITAIWIYFLLCQHLNFAGIILTGLFLLLTPACFFLKQFKWSSAAFLLIFTLITVHYCKAEITLNEITNNKWLPFNEEVLNKLIKENKTIFVDITANWCMTCHYNKSFVLNQKEVQTMLDNIIYMKGDLSNDNSIIWEYVHSRKRSGIPLNVIYGPGAPYGINLPEILTAQEIKQAIETAIAIYHP